MLRTLLILCCWLLSVSTVVAAELPRVEVPLGDAPSRGAATAAVTMVEFIDFQ